MSSFVDTPKVVAVSTKINVKQKQNNTRKITMEGVTNALDTVDCASSDNGSHTQNFDGLLSSNTRERRTIRPLLVA